MIYHRENFIKSLYWIIITIFFFSQPSHITQALDYTRDPLYTVFQSFFSIANYIVYEFFICSQHPIILIYRDLGTFRNIYM